MKALYYKEAGDGAILDVPKPVCGDGQVIIKVMSASICKGVEMGHAQNGTGLSIYPVIPGHEFAGFVDEIGNDVTNVKIGDRVTADNTKLCGECYYCQKNMPLYCEKFGSLGHNINGGFAEYVVVDKEKVFSIPEEMTFDMACLAEPVACCVHAVDRADVKFGEVVVVVGDGPNGQILCQLLSKSNAESVILLGRHQSKLDLAAKYGTICIKVDGNNTDFIETVKKRFPQGVDCVIDATGNMTSVTNSFQLLKKGGRVVQYGVPHADVDVKIPGFYFFVNELSYIASMAQTHCYGKALDYINNGTIDLETLVTHTCSLDDYFTALDLTFNDRNQMKIIIHPWEAE